MHGCLGFFHSFADTCKLVFGAFSGVLGSKCKCRLRRQRRPAFPDQVDQIFGVVDLGMLVFQSLLQSLPSAHRYDASVESESSAFRHHVGNIILQCRYIRLPHLEERDTASFQLIGGLDKVSAVREQPGLCLRDDGRSGRSGKACDECSRFKMFPHIFALMVIVGGDQIYVVSPVLHQSPKRGEFFRYCHVNPFLSYYIS